jgi:hypothetical protein
MWTGRQTGRQADGLTDMRKVIVAFRKFAQALKNLLLHETVLWRIYVTGKNETYFGLRVKYLIFLSDFKQIRRFSIDSHKSKIQTAGKSVQLRTTDRQTQGYD